MMTAAAASTLFFELSGIALLVLELFGLRRRLAPLRPAILVVLGTVLVGSAVARSMDALPERIAPDDGPIVMGFATEGLRDASLPWSSLTDVVCFSLEAKRDGRLHDGCGWPWTGFVKKARSHDVRVSLCVTARDGGDIESLVTQPIEDELQDL